MRGYIVVSHCVNDEPPTILTIPRLPWSNYTVATTCLLKYRALLHPFNAFVVQELY